MHSIAARFKHAGVFMALTVPFLTLSMASPAVAATPLATDSASDDNIWLTIAIVAVGVALMSCIALALTVAKTRRNRTKLAQPLGAPVFPQMPSAPSAPVLGAPGFPQAMASASSAPALGYRPYIAPTPSLAPTAPAGLPLTAQPVNEVYPQRYGVPSQPDSGDLATLSHPNQNVQLAHELATPEGNQTRLVSTDWQMPPAGSSD